MRARAMGTFLAMVWAAASVAATPPPAPAAAPASDGITVNVTGIQYKRGPMLDVMVYASEKDKDADNALVEHKLTLKPGATEHTFVLRGVPTGRFMIVGAQDANGNGELDSSLIGIPKEGYFTSGNKRMPTWKGCSFEYDGKSLALEVKMIYW